MLTNSVYEETIGLIEMQQSESKSHVSFCLPFMFDRMIDRHSEVRKKEVAHICYLICCKRYFSFTKTPLRLKLRDK